MRLTPQLSPCSHDNCSCPFQSRKTLDVVTLFHKAGSPASVKVVNLLKQVSAGTQGDAVKDGPVQREPFELNVTEDNPTPEQVETMLQYVGNNGISSIIKGARDEKDAMRRYKESKENLLRPIVRFHGHPLSFLALTLPSW